MIKVQKYTNTDKRTKGDSIMDKLWKLIALLRLFFCIIQCFLILFCKAPMGREYIRTLHSLYVKLLSIKFFHRSPGSYEPPLESHRTPRGHAPLFEKRYFNTINSVINLFPISFFQSYFSTTVTLLTKKTEIWKFFKNSIP